MQSKSGCRLAGGTLNKEKLKNTQAQTTQTRRTRTQAHVRFVITQDSTASVKNDCSKLAVRHSILLIYDSILTTSKKAVPLFFAKITEYREVTKQKTAL